MSDKLKDQAWNFAQQLMHMLAGVLPQGNLGIDLLADESNAHFAIFSAEDKGIELQVAQKTMMRLEIDYKLSSDRTGEWLKVISSSFSLVPDGNGAPFFRYDFLDGAHSVPEAHLNIHAHRDDLIATLLGTSSSALAKRRRKNFIERGSLPRVANIHFPVGGKRFRPCIEEILEMIILEFGIDVRSTWKDAIHEGIRSHRSTQLKAAVRDNPLTALQALQDLGYDLQTQQ